MAVCLRPFRARLRDLRPVAPGNESEHSPSVKKASKDVEISKHHDLVGMIQIDISEAKEPNARLRESIGNDYENDEILHLREQQEVVDQISVLWYDMEGRHLKWLENIDLEYVNTRWKSFLEELGESVSDGDAQ
jgi:hypothetical protein